MRAAMKVLDMPIVSIARLSELHRQSDAKQTHPSRGPVHLVTQFSRTDAAMHANSYISTNAKRRFLRSAVESVTRIVQVSIVGLASLSMASSNLADGGEVQPIERLGRWSGVGWGDGYHACEKSPERIGADLPPRSYHATFGDRATPACGTVLSHRTNRQATYYDRFDAANQASCDASSCDAPSCDAVGYDHPASTDGFSEYHFESSGDAEDDVPMPIAPSVLERKAAPEMPADPSAVQSTLVRPRPIRPQLSSRISAPRAVTEIPVSYQLSSFPQPISLGQDPETTKPIAAKPIAAEPIAAEPRPRPTRLPVVVRRIEKVETVAADQPKIRMVRLTSGSESGAMVKRNPFFQ